MPSKIEWTMKILDSFNVGGRDGFGRRRRSRGSRTALAIPRSLRKAKIRPLQVYHGKAGRGLSVEMSVKHGPVLLLSVVETARGGPRLLSVEGKSVSGPIIEIGNKNSRYRFPVGNRRFVKEWNRQGSAHYCRS